MVGGGVKSCWGMLNGEGVCRCSRKQTMLRMKKTATTASKE